MNSKLREALERCVKMLDICLLYSHEGYPGQNDDIRKVMAQAENALAAPPRNCDKFDNFDKAQKRFLRETGRVIVGEEMYDWLFDEAKGDAK